MLGQFCTGYAFWTFCSYFLSIFVYIDPFRTTFADLTIWPIVSLHEDKVSHGIYCSPVMTKYVRNCVGIISFVLFQVEWSLSLKFFIISLHSFSFWVSLNFSYTRWRFLDILATLRESLYSNLFVLDFVTPFLVLSLYVFFITSFHFITFHL